MRSRRFSVLIGILVIASGCDLRLGYSSQVPGEGVGSQMRMAKSFCWQRMQKELPMYFGGLENVSWTGNLPHPHSPATEVIMTPSGFPHSYTNRETNIEYDSAGRKHRGTSVGANSRDGDLTVT
jgi:hypothetical protein